MPKKAKLGKSRRDKAYWAAKEIGYRSRASFKLVQLNRKWEFLQKSSVCIDLCAAPGSWMQVCRENMPMSSLVVGVDLAPIKPLPGCIALQEDITTEKCKSMLKKELKTAKADLVLHDGAPNVGKNWIHDAYQQSLLTLHAFKLATSFLCRGGWFVTKVFRSKDYQSLIWVLSQFFKKVHATKPAASRNESAEIFVVCQGYLAPDKIDPKFLDPRSVFSDIEVENRKLTTEIINPEKAKKKPASEGYADGATDKGLLYNEVKASEFIMGNNHIQMLNQANRIVVDTPKIKKHPKTTQEIVECLNDIKVLGMKDLRNLKKWRDALRKEFEALDNEKKKEGEVVEVPAILEKTKEELEDEELQEMDKKISDLQDEERRAERRKKKKEAKEKHKRIERLNLKMIIPGDEGPTATEEGLFRMSDLKSKDDLDNVINSRAEEVASDSDDEEVVKKRKFERFEREKGHINKDGLWYEEEHPESGDEKSEDSDDEKEDLGLEAEEDDMDVDNVNIDDQEADSANPLMETLVKETAEEKKTKKAELWFQKLGDIDSDSDLEDAEIQKAVTSVQKKGATLRQKKEEPQESGYTSGSDDDEESDPKLKAVLAGAGAVVGGAVTDDSDSDSDDDSSSDDEAVQDPKAGFEIVKQPKIKKRKALSAEELALGESLVSSKKRKRDIMDAGWNRYMFEDTGLPDWFIQEEEMHMRKQLDVDPATLAKYKERENEVNVKTIKKVVEAKARRKRRVAKRLEKAKKKATVLMDDQDVGTREKQKEIKKMYRAAHAEGKKKDVKYVVAKKHNASKRASRPAGTKGPYKQVDPRMKKDNKTKRGNATGKKNQKRRLKGKQAKPTKQFNTNR